MIFLLLLILTKVRDPFHNNSINYCSLLKLHIHLLIHLYIHIYIYTFFSESWSQFHEFLVIFSNLQWKRVSILEHHSTNSGGFMIYNHN